MKTALSNFSYIQTMTLYQRRYLVGHVWAALREIIPRVRLSRVVGVCRMVAIAGSVLVITVRHSALPRDAVTALLQV